MEASIRLLVSELPGETSAPPMAQATAAGALRFTAEDPPRSVTMRGRVGTSRADPPATWRAVRTNAASSQANPWDVAHAYQQQHPDQTRRVEPDVAHPYCHDPTPASEAFRASNFFAADRCAILPYDPDWPAPTDQRAWHLADDYSQLIEAQRLANEPDPAPVRILHVDTGYDPQHATRPAGLNTSLQRNFVADENPTDATDPSTDQRTNLLKQPGHGTATLALLAGQPTPALGDALGGAPQAEVVPVRIARSVIVFNTEALTQALRYAAQIGCDVVTLSMGGLASGAVADAVNELYEAGILLVAAAGNNLGGITPARVVYPARFGRAVAACGVTYANQPYNRGLTFNGLQGNFGPPKLMQRALAAYTPNVPWALLGCGAGVAWDGAGTSSATPQIAAAASLYLRKYKKMMAAYGYAPWQRVEATRQALFAAADKSQPDSARYFGNGILKAADALAVAPPRTPTFVKAPPDRVSFPLFRVVTGLALPAEPVNRVVNDMLETELAQLTQRHPELEKLLGNHLGLVGVRAANKRRFVKQLLALPDASQTLKTHVRTHQAEILSR